MFKPVEFLDFSKSLLNKETIIENEAFYRSIISRSYYSALLTTREKIDEFDEDILRSGRKPPHDDIIDNMVKLPTDKLNIIQLRTLRKNLRELKWYRMSADYKFDDANHEKEKNYVKNKDPTNQIYATYVLNSANKIVNDISNIKIQ